MQFGFHDGYFTRGGRAHRVRDDAYWGNPQFLRLVCDLDCTDYDPSTGQIVRRYVQNGFPAWNQRWGDIDTALSAIRQFNTDFGKQVKVLPVVYKTSGAAGVPADSKFKDYIYHLLAHIGYSKGVGIAGVEIWNEPNIAAFGSVSANHVCALAGQAYLALVTLNWTTVVPVIAGAPFASTPQGTWRDYLTRYAQEPNWLKAGLHPYSFKGQCGARSNGINCGQAGAACISDNPCQDDPVDAPAEAANDVANRIDDAKSLIGTKPLHITEIGLSSTLGRWDEAKQNSYVSFIYDYARNRTVASFTYWRAADVAYGSGCQCRYRGMGARRQGGSEPGKPVLATLAAKPR